MILNFFKGFGVALVALLLIWLLGWVFSLILDFAAGLWGLVFGWTLPSIIILVICIIVGLIYMFRSR